MLTKNLVYTRISNNLANFRAVIDFTPAHLLLALYSCLIAKSAVLRVGHIQAHSLPSEYVTSPSTAVGRCFWEPPYIVNAWAPTQSKPTPFHP